jgi:hypothetical protein
VPERDADPPTVSADVLEGWRRTETNAETLFELGVIRVTAHTAVYEDRALRERIRSRTDVDHPWRFVFTTRIVLEPTSSVTGALRRLVSDRARSGFTDRLRDRGISDVREVDSRSIRVADADADAHRYAGRVELTELTLSVTGWLTVWPSDGEFLLVGGIYPTAVEDSADDETAATVRAALDPDQFRTSLFELVRATR